MPKVRRIQRQTGAVGGRALKVVACRVLSDSLFGYFPLPASIARFCPRKHDPPAYLAVGHSCSCSTQAPWGPTRSYFSEVQVVCLLLGYAKGEGGDDYRFHLDASVHRLGDVDPVEVVDIVERYAVNCQN